MLVISWKVDDSGFCKFSVFVLDISVLVLDSTGRLCVNLLDLNFFM